MTHRFIKDNRKLFYITLISIAIVFTYYVSYNLPEIIPGINKWYELLVTLSMGVIVNCIFYYMRISCSIPVRASFTLFRKEHEYVRALLLLAAIKHESLAIVAAQTTTFRSESG